MKTMTISYESGTYNKWFRIYDGNLCLLSTKLPLKLPYRNGLFYLVYSSGGKIVEKEEHRWQAYVEINDGEIQCYFPYTGNKATFHCEEDRWFFVEVRE